MKRWNRITTMSALGTALGLIGIMALAMPASAGSAGNAPWLEPQWLQAETLQQGDDGGYARQVVLHCASEADWNRAMHRLQREGAIWTLPLPAAPADVNWETQDVVLVSIGRKTEIGYTCEIESLQQLDESLIVDIAVTIPTAKQGCDPYYPYHMMVIENCGTDRIEAQYYYSVAANNEQDSDPEMLAAQ